MSSNFSQILGHKRQIAALERCEENNTKHGVFLFVGPEHIGKATVAKAFAAGLLGVSVDELFRHPDVVLLEPLVNEKGTKSYDIDVIRAVLHRLSQSSVLGQTVAIIDDANLLNIQSQNALLKTLEEPGQSTMIILVAHDESAMLPTIRSRTIVLSFFGIPPEASEETVRDAKRMISPSLVERLKAAQDIAKQESLNRDMFFLAMVQELHSAHRATADRLSAILSAYDHLGANGNSTITFTELAVQLGQYE